MSNKRQIQNWVAIAVILVVTSLLAAVWPAITGWFSEGGGGGGLSFDVSMQTVVINLPFEVAGTAVLELSSLAIVAILTVVVIGVVIGGGAVIAGLYTLLFRTTQEVKESESFQEGQAALEQKEKERLAQLQEGRESNGSEEEEDRTVWPTISTTLIVLFFTTLIGTILSRGLNVTGTESFLGLQVSHTLLIIGGLNLLAVFIAAWIFRPQRMKEIGETDYGPIPWDSLWVIITGLIVVGIGAGIVIYINTPQ